MRQEPAKRGKGKTVKLKVHARKSTPSGGFREITDDFDVPASLKDAVKIYGEHEVFKLFINSLIINLQAQLRRGERKGNYTWADAIVDAATGRR